MSIPARRLDRTRRKLIGLLKSKLGHAGLWLAVLGQLQAQSGILTRHLNPEQVGDVLSLIGLLVVALRWWTSQPLEDKGGVR